MTTSKHNLTPLLISLSVIAGVLNGAPLPSTPPDKPTLARPINKNRSAARDATNQLAFANNTNIFLRPGLIADRLLHTVTIAAETIRLDLNAPVEFPLISENSGKDYEALAVSFASPSDIHAALEFIGIPPGKAVNPGASRFWSRGEPVNMTFTYDEPAGTSSITRTVPATQLITDTRTRKPLPDEPFLFAGSERVPPPDPADGTNLIYAADVFSPNCIASVYNEASTVLDVPRRITQNEVYSFLVSNPDLRLPSASLATVTLTPQYTNGHRRVTDLTLGMHHLNNENTASWTLTLGKSVEHGTNVVALVSRLNQLAAGDRDLYVTLNPDDTLTLDALHRLAVLLEPLEDRALIHIEPPLPGHPYYKTFRPAEKHRNRSERPVQPWELYLTAAGTGATGELVHVEELWTDDGRPSTYKETRHPASGPGILPELLLKHDAPAVVLVFASPDLAYGTIRHFLAPLLDRRMIVYVFEN
jgi:hypothetical protein